MKTSMISSMKSSMITSMVNPDSGGATKRIFAELDGGHYAYTTTLVFGAGDTYKFKFLAPTGIVAARQAITDGDGASDRGFFFLKDDGLYLTPATISFTVDGLAMDDSDNYPVDGNLHEVVMTFSGGERIKMLSTRFDLTGNYVGILSDVVATISGVTTTNALGLATGNTEQSLEANNSVTYVSILESKREEFQLSADETQWDNISALPQELQAVINIAPP